MKYFSKLGLYKASNVTYNPSQFEAFSYGWWQFATIEQGFKIFNNYRYSPSTGQQQGKVMKKIGYDNLNDVIFLECPKGLQNSEWKTNVKKHYAYQIETMTEKMNKKLTRQKTKDSLIVEIRKAENRINFVQALEDKDSEKASHFATLILAERVS
jgi:hypothetical protein